MVGEVRTESIIFKTGEVIISKEGIYDREDVEKKKKYLKDKSDMELIIDSQLGSFYFHFFDKFKDVDISNQMKTRFLYICTFMDYDGRLVDTDKNTNAMAIMDRDMMFLKLGLGKTEFYKTLNTFLELKLIVEEKNHMLVSKDFVIKGKLSCMEKDDVYTRVFYNGVKKLYKNTTTRQHGRLYYLYMLLPYINLETNVVCSNPDEHNPSFIRPLTLKDICTIVDYNTNQLSTFTKILLDLTVDGKFVIAKVTIGSGEFIKVNPCAYYGGVEIDNLKTLMLDFKYDMERFTGTV